MKGPYRNYAHKRKTAVERGLSWDIKDNPKDRGSVTEAKITVVIGKDCITNLKISLREEGE